MDARERARLATESIDDEAEYYAPLFELFVIYCYLNGARLFPEVQRELINTVSYASSYDDGRIAPVFAKISGRSLRAISDIAIPDMMEDMSRRYRDAMVHHGLVSIES